MRWRAVLALCLLLACNDKSNAGDAGDASADARVRDAGNDAGADAGVDDLAPPPPVNDELLGRVRHLLEAVSQDNPDLAGDMLFPRDAYMASSGASDPQKAWEKRVQGLFKRSVERTHKKNKGIENAKFVGFELGHSILQLTPKKHDLKKPLWRVKHSKLTFTIDGKLRHLDIAELTAWRGNWYVTRLR